MIHEAIVEVRRRSRLYGAAGTFILLAFIKNYYMLWLYCWKSLTGMKNKREI